MKQVNIYCDGACTSGNGGFAVILNYKDNKKVITGSETETTNNRMEMKGAIIGLQALKFPCQVNLYSDSQYLVNTMNKNWKRNKNIDLWKEIDELNKLHQITWIWVARNSLPEMAECDRLAKSMK